MRWKPSSNGGTRGERATHTSGGGFTIHIKTGEHKMKTTHHGGQCGFLKYQQKKTTPCRKQCEMLPQVGSTAVNVRAAKKQKHKRRKYNPSKGLPWGKQKIIPPVCAWCVWWMSRMQGPKWIQKRGKEMNFQSRKVDTRAKPKDLTTRRPKAGGRGPGKKLQHAVFPCGPPPQY